MTGNVHLVRAMKTKGFARGTDRVHANMMMIVVLMNALFRMRFIWEISFVLRSAQSRSHVEMGLFRKVKSANTEIIRVADAQKSASLSDRIFAATVM